MKKTSCTHQQRKSAENYLKRKREYTEYHKQLQHGKVSKQPSIFFREK